MPQNVEKRHRAVEDVDEDDLLRHLDVAYRREQWKAMKRRYRLLKKTKERQASGDVPDRDDRTDRTPRFAQPISAEEKMECMKLLQGMLGAEGLDECVCVICDRLVLRLDAVRKETADWRYIDQLRKLLGEGGDDLPKLLVDQYSAPLHVQGLENVLISPRGVHCYIDEDDYPNAWMSVCKKCDASIRAQKLPKFAVANGFFIGRLPEHMSRLTIPERFMTQLASFGAVTRVMRGGRHRCIRSHCVAFDCTPGPPVLLLPRSLEDVISYRVVLVGDFTEGQEQKIRKMHRIRSAVVRDAFIFFKAFNVLYEDISPNDDILDEYPDEEIDRHFMERVEDDGDFYDAAMSAEQENVRGQSDTWRTTDADDEEAVLERRIGLTDDSPPVMDGSHPFVAEIGEGPARKERDFMIRRSDHISNDASGDLFARMFSHLFPFGRGHPGESRRDVVSLKECVKHYIALSDQQFAADELFVLVAFDRISMQNMYIQHSIRCQRFPNIYEGYENIGVHQLGSALLDNERRRQGCLPRGKNDDPVTSSFLKSVELATGAVWGSNTERSQWRRKAFAYQTRFGQPALFVTLTPNSDNSFAMAQYTRVSSVETLFDILDARVPSKAELRKASLGNDCASARLFMRHVDAFITCVLGMDPLTKKQKAHRGLFGEILAYFGMVETQGRGTLHVHFLLWLKDCPPNSAAVEKVLSSAGSEQFCESVAAYVNTIVSNDLPIALSEYECSTCGASKLHLVALPIPETARKDPHAGKRCGRSRKTVFEPPLLQCTNCSTKFSSQHVLRSVLLRHRPLHWPPWEKCLSSEEIAEQASVEMTCRDTKKQAFDVVEEREKIMASVSGEGDVTHESGLTPIETAKLLDQANCLQMEACKADDDLFQNDYLTRLVEMLPPSPSDSRMTKESLDYMVSALVLLLIQAIACQP